MGEIADLFKWVSFDNALQFTKEAVLFYIKPKYFFQEIFKKDTKEKITQIAFYYATLLAILFLFADRTMTILMRNLITSVSAQVLMFSIPITIGIYLTKKIFKIPEISLAEIVGNAIIFVLCSCIFVSPIITFFLSVYIKTQEYEWLLLALISTVLLLYFINIFYSVVFFERIKHILTAFLITFIFWNITVITIIKLPSLDSYKSNEIVKMTDIDPIYTEYEQLKSRLEYEKSEYVPYYKLEMYDNKKKKNIWVGFGFANRATSLNNVLDSLNYNFFKSDTVVVIYNNSSRILTKAIDSLKFDRNKLYFRKVFNYYKAVEIYKTQSQDTSTALFIQRGNTGNHRLYVYASQALADKYIDIVNDDIIRYKARSMAQIPAYYALGIYFFPVLKFIPEK